MTFSLRAPTHVRADAFAAEYRYECGSVSGFTGVPQRGAEMSKREKVRQIVSRALRDTGDTQPFTDSDSLIVSGRLSSVDVVNVLLLLEEAFGFAMSPEDFDVLRFDTVDSIVGLLP